MVMVTCSQVALYVVCISEAVRGGPCINYCYIYIYIYYNI
jgi:hypothetical protein